MNKKGFTLLELIIATAIMAIVMSISYILIAEGNLAFKVVSSNSDVEQNVRFAMNTILSALRSTDVPLIKVDAEKNRIIADKSTYYRLGNSVYESIDGTSNEIAYSIENFDISLEGNVINITITGYNEGKYRFSLSGCYALRE